MPQIIELQTIPSQSLSIILEERRFDIRIKKCVDVMAIDIARDNVTIVEGMRCLPEQALMPYRYQEGDAGNFAFYTEDDELPDYELFGVTQFLLYFTAEELAVQRGES